MRLVERETFMLWSRTDGYRERIAAAQELLRELMDEFRCYVAYSGGKDSTVLLHMALQVDPEISVWHWDYGPYYMPRELEREVLVIAKKLGAKNIVVHTSSEYRDGRKSENVFFRNLFSWVADEMSKRFDCCLLGLRAEESVKRRLKTSKQICCSKKPIEAYPIHGLTARDIWAYIVSHNLPYCSHYDRYGELLGIENVRFATFFDPEFDKFGTSNIDGVLMSWFKNCDVRGGSA